MAVSKYNNAKTVYCDLMFKYQESNRVVKRASKSKIISKAKNFSPMQLTKA